MSESDNESKFSFELIVGLMKHRPRRSSLPVAVENLENPCATSEQTRTHRGAPGHVILKGKLTWITPEKHGLNNISHNIGIRPRETPI
jgi:hypothetical protein